MKLASLAAGFLVAAAAAALEAVETVEAVDGVRPMPESQDGPRHVSYRGAQVLRLPVHAHNAAAIDGAIADLGLDAWQDARRVGRYADVVVPADQVEALKGRLATADADADADTGAATTTTITTMHADLEAAIAAEGRYEAYAAGTANATWFRSFHAYADHLRFLGALQARFPHNTALVSSGVSLLGRNITGLRIFGSGGGGVRRPALVLHGTVHAREWIATMVVEYIAYRMATALDDQTSDDAAAAAAAAGLAAHLERYDVYAFPVVNPDGFVYTQTTDRLWRKNRQDTANSTCVGRDINRNWPIAWEATGGASTNPCAQDFRGGAQADAPETAALARWLHATQAAQGIQLYVDYHSYGELFMTPYGYTCERQPARSAELLRLAEGAATAIYGVHGTFFQWGGICSMLYKSTGSSVDYVHEAVGAAHSFTSELRDMGQTGFVLPPAQILPGCEEAFAGVQYLMENMRT